MPVVRYNGLLVSNGVVQVHPVRMHDAVRSRLWRCGSCGALHLRRGRRRRHFLAADRHAL